EQTRRIKAAAGGSAIGALGWTLGSRWLPVTLKAALTPAALRLAASLVDTALVSNLGRVDDPPRFGSAGTATAMRFSVPAPMLRELYEDPRVPLASGLDRTRRMLDLLGGITRAEARPLHILDVGCGDGAATSLTAARARGHHVVGMDWSQAALRQASERGLS